MNTHRIVMDGVTYGNVGKIDTSTEPVYYYDVVTLDGKSHRSIRYHKTVHKVQFFNLLDGVYDGLKALVKSLGDDSLECGFPDDDNGFVYDNYLLEITGEINKGYHNGKYFRNGLEIEFTKVNADG